MWDNFVNHSAKLNAPNDILTKSTSASIEKKTSAKQIFESDTDFQTFLLPLEQDFTKSSKGYASLLTSTTDKEIKSVDCKNGSEKSKKNVLLNDISETDALKNNTNSKLFHNYSSYSSDLECTGNHNELCYQKCTQLSHNILENIESDQISKIMPVESYANIVHSQNFHNKGLVFEKQESVHTENCIKTMCNFSVKLSNADKLNSTSDDDSCESSETDTFYNGFNSQNFVDDSSSDDSIVFCEEDGKNKHWYSNTEIKHTFVTAIDSESSYDSYVESKDNTSVFYSEDFAFECDSVDLLKNPMALERNIYSSIIASRSEGYVNASFEDDFLIEKSTKLKSVNKIWNDSMKNISEEPHEPKRVSFVPLPNLVSIFQYEPDDDDYCYSLYVLDQLRFRNRIEEFEYIISPYLTPEHRTNIYQRNYFRD